jgi:hypothetical protein
MPRLRPRGEAFAYPPGRISMQHHNIRPPASVVDALSGHPRGSEGACMQDPASELPRIPVPETV